MSDSSFESSNWQPWQMTRLERRRTERADDITRGPPSRGRRREDAISMTLFELAKEDAAAAGREAGFDEGYKAGYDEGLAQVRAEHEQALAEEVAARIAPIATLAEAFASAIDGLKEDVAYRLVELALATGRQLAGRALELKPEHILDDIEDMLVDNPALAGEPTLYVNIDDLALIQTQLGETLTASGWQLKPDVNLERGDCRIETATREIDATLGDRLSRLLHAVGHGEH